MYGVRTDYYQGRKRDYVSVWSGAFMSVFEAHGVSLPNMDGYMLTLNNGDKVRVVCPCPRDDNNWSEVDAAIVAAMEAREAD